MGKIISRINEAFDFGRNLFEVGELFGVTRGSIGLGIAYLAWLGWLMLKDAVPPWGYMLAAPVALIMVLLLYTALRRAWAVRSIQPVSLEKVADACDRATERYLNFVEANNEQFVALVVSRYSPSSGPINWEERNKKLQTLEYNLISKIKEKIGGEIGAAIAMLHSVGVYIHPEFGSVDWIDGMMRKIQACGKLLRSGQLEAAKKIQSYPL
jgi:hypothetical protein